MEDPSLCFHQPHCIPQENSHELLFAQYLRLCVLLLPFSCSPKIIFRQSFKSCKSGFVPQSMLFVEGGKYLRRLHFIPKQLKYLKPFIPKQLKLPNPPLSKQFLHFKLIVTTSNTQRFKQFKPYLFADTTNDDLFLAIF